MSAMSNFDDFTKKQLDNYSPDVPSHIWENIVAARKKKKPYPFVFKMFNKQNLLLVAGIIALLTGGAVYFLKTDKKTAVTENDSIAQQHSTEKKLQQADSPNKNSKEIFKNDNSENSVVKADPAPEKITAEKQEVGLGDSRGSEADVSSSPTKKNSLLKEQLSSVPGSRNYQAYKKTKSVLKNKSTAPGIFNESNTTSTNDKENNLEEAGNFLTSLLMFPEKITAEDRRGGRLNTSMLPALQSPPCPVIEKNAAGNKYYIELYAGPDYASKHFSDTANSLLMEKRKASTSFRSAFSAGFRYTRVFNNGASIRAGINYSQINEKFTYVQSNITQVTYITDPITGDTTGTFLTTGTRYKTTNNKYHTLDIPVLLGFETGNGRIHANFNAGVVLNIYSWQKGESLDTSYRPVTISTGKGATLYQYKTNIGAGFMGGVSVYYKLNDQLHLLAEPYLRYNFSPMNKDMLSLQEKFTTIGLRLGIRLDLD